MVADLIECVHYSTGHLEAIEEALPQLRAAADAKPEDGDSQADLAIALSALDETEEATELFRKALDHEDSLCFINHRDCLNNIGWNLYLRKQYDNALPWFEKACWIEPSTDKETEHAHIEDLEPPYKLALENQLLCLAKLGRLREAAEQLTVYLDEIGRLPRYETQALRKLGLDADIAFIRRNIEMSNKAESTPSA
jgi:Tfp pilus assembly protein PilF